LANIYLRRWTGALPAEISQAADVSQGRNVNICNRDLNIRDRMNLIERSGKWDNPISQST